MKLLFVNAHPDDVEFTCASTCQQAVNLGWQVIQLLMTSDEYGTNRNDFKGKRIRRIRIHEMEEAAKVYGTNQDGSPKIKLIYHSLTKEKYNGLAKQECYHSEQTACPSSVNVKLIFQKGDCRLRQRYRRRNPCQKEHYKPQKSEYRT